MPKLPGISEVEEEKIEIMSSRVINKLLHPLIENLKEAARQEEDQILAAAEQLLKQELPSPGAKGQMPEDTRGKE